MRELTRRCLDLPRRQKEQLIRILRESLDNEIPDSDKAKCKDRFTFLYKIATDMFGKGILSSKRDRELVMARRCIAYMMRKEGYSLNAIGQRLVKHHTSVMHLCAMMEDAIKFKFHDEVELWEEFQERVRKEERKANSIWGNIKSVITNTL